MRGQELKIECRQIDDIRNKEENMVLLYCRPCTVTKRECRTGSDIDFQTGKYGEKQGTWVCVSPSRNS